MNKKKCVVLLLIAILFSLIAYVLAQEALDTDNVFEIVVNNTNLAPNVAGHPPGTGERITGVTYWTNTSPIQILLYAHADTSGQNAKISLNINNTTVLVSAPRPAGIAENTYTQISTIIPKGSNYSANFTNYHHYEWREYQVLSGKNGTLSVNQTVSDAQLNTKVNKSGDTMTGKLEQTFNTTSYQFRGGGFVMQGYGVNNGFIGDNIYFDGTGFKYISTGTGTLLNFYNGAFRIQHFRSMTAGSYNDENGGNGNIDLVSDLDGNTTLRILSGSGNAAVCVDSTGKLFRSTNATSNYLTC